MLASGTSIGSEQLTGLLQMEEFPLSSKYESRWIIDKQMGPNALWLTEWL